MKVTFRMVSHVAEPDVSGEMELAIRENARMTKCMEKESIISLMG